jgi:DNA-binding ferritin-like protein
MVALNQVLSEMIDMVMAVRQAHQKVPGTHALHAELGELFNDAKRWADLLMAADTARGVSALDYMPSVAGRQRPDLWHGPVADEEVRRVVAEQLDRLAEHLEAALSEQDDDHVRELLDGINAELESHRDALREP